MGYYAAQNAVPAARTVAVTNIASNPTSQSVAPVTTNITLKRIRQLSTRSAKSSQRS